MKLIKIITDSTSEKTQSIYADDNIGSFSVNSTIKKYQADDYTSKFYPNELVVDASVSTKLIETDIDGRIVVTKWDYDKGEDVSVVIEADKEWPRPFAEENVYLSDTYTLIRTNPKYTGNVKLVVDSKEDMYLDTFKVNTALSKTKYHKVPVSYKSYYGKDVMALFNEMSSDDFYCIAADDKKIFTQAPNLSKQFIDTYRSGVKTNVDTTYSESFSILSPLNIGSIVPDFFVIFKIKNSTPSNIDKKDVFEYLLRYGEQIKTFDLRKDSKIGQYLRTIRKHSIDVAAPIFMSRMDDAQVVYNGISIDKGVVTKAYETNKRDKKEDKINSKSYEEMNYNFIEGFERNRLISSNTINLEFMFDDPTSEQFSINTYVGLYLYSNDLYKDVYYDGSLRLDNGDLAYSNGYYEIKNSSEDQLNFIMYGFEDSDGFTRCKSASDEDAYKNHIRCTLGENIINTDVSKIDTNNDYDSFITITLNNEDAITPGEHYRILDYVDPGERDVDICPCIYEIIISDETRTGEIIGQESIYYKKGFTLNNNVKTEMEVCTHTIPIYVNNIAINYLDKSLSSEERKKLLNEKIKMVAKYMYNAFNSFTTDQKNTIRFKATRYHDSTITIAGDIVHKGKTPTDPNVIKKLIFERISHLTAYNAISSENSIESLKEFTEEDKLALTVFGNYAPIPMVIDFSDPSASCPTHKDEIASMLTPFYFEDLKARIVYAIDFYDFTNGGLLDVDFYDGYVDLTESMQDENLCYMRRYIKAGETKYTSEYAEYDKFKINMYDLDNDNAMVDTYIETNALLSFRNPKKYMFRFEDHTPEDGKLSLHKHNLFDRVICNIIPIKDYDFALNGEDNTWNVTQKFLDDVTASNNTAKEIVYNLIKIGATPKNEGYYDETVGTFIGKLYRSDKSIVNSFVSPFIFKWTTTGGVSGSSSGKQAIYGAKNNVPFKDFNNYDAGVSIKNYGSLYKKDLSKIYNRETLRTNIINGTIDFNDIINEINVTRSIGILSSTSTAKSTLDFSEGSKLYKISNNSFGFIERGIPVKISFANITNASILDNINGCVLHNIESKATGDNYSSELYIDQLKKKAYYVSYGDSSVSKEIEFKENSSEVLPSNIHMTGTGSLKIPQKLFKNSSNLNNTKVLIVLHNESYTIIAQETTYNGKTNDDVVIDHYAVFFRKTLPENVASGYIYTYDMMDKDAFMNSLVDDDHVTFISTMSHILSKTTPFKMYYKSNLSDAYKQEVVLPTNVSYLPVYLKFGDNSGYTLYEDNYDVSVTHDVIYDSSISPIYTDSTKMTKTLNTYITPKLVDVLYRNCITLDMDNGGESISCEKLYGFNWRGDIPYNKYWGTEYNPTFTGIMADKDIVMVDAEFCKITNGTVFDFPNIMRNCFDRNMYHAKTQYKYIKSRGIKLAAKPVLLTRDSVIPGYTSGYMIKTFINGLSLQKKKTDKDGKQYGTFEVNGWTKIFKKNDYVYYDLSDAIEKQIMSNTNFSEIWKYLNANTRENKVRFINNTIIPMLHITDNMMVDVYFKVGKTNSFSSKFISTKTKKIENAPVSVEYENGRYLLKLKPQNSVRGTYYIKCNITL